MRCFYLGRASATPGVGALEPALDAAPPDPVPAELRAGLTRKSPALFIYTSGTTGEGAPTSDLSPGPDPDRAPKCPGGSHGGPAGAWDLTSGPQTPP